MGDLVGSIFGDDQADAAKKASNAQVQATREAIAGQERMLDKQLNFSKESRDIARGDLQPFRQAGADNITGLVDLITNPQKQLEFVQNNPFFNAMATRAKDDVFGNMAAKGKLGSGGTAEALQNSLLLLGSDLLNQNIGQRQNLVTMGQNAAAGQATTTMNTAGLANSAMSNAGNNISNLVTDAGNARAAGYVGAANARTNATNNLISTALSAYELSDIRAKENIRHVGYLNNGLPIYMFNYKDDDQQHINVMAQEVEIIDPSAVMEHKGLKYVDMEKVASWQSTH
jgi:hypothetical protein